MRASSAPGVVLVALALAAGLVGGGCSGDDGGGASADAGPGGADAAGDPTCSPTGARAQAPEVFVGPTGLEARLLAAIGSATTSLDIMMYLFTLDQLADAVIAAHRRGVAVRVLLDPEHAGNVDTRAALMAAGVPTRNVSSLYEFAHAKYLVIDGDEAIIMSANFAFTSIDSERNYGVIDRDPDDVADLRAIFDGDWGGTAADLSCTRLVVSPTNARTRITGLVEGARATLDLEVIYLAEPTVRAAVIAAHQRGVAVRVILADPGDYPDNTPVVTELRAAGLEVKLARSFDIHAKLIVADGVYLVGSQNMSTTSLTRNREVGVMLTDAPTIASQFTSDWAAASN
ncbi:MAG: hypothetical protein KBG28_07690 [Kofleriaceae bacterium]|nr:hypothetical protein [Kofleriaceae bacterium]